MEGGDKVREFASGLSGNHALNRTDGQSDLLASAELLSGAELTERYGAIVEQRIAGVLEKNEALPAFAGSGLSATCWCRSALGTLISLRP